MFVIKVLLLKDRYFPYNKVYPGYFVTNSFVHHSHLPAINSVLTAFKNKTMNDSSGMCRRSKPPFECHLNESVWFMFGDLI